MSKLVDLIGQRFNYLVVIERVANQGAVTRWKCQCDCGNITIVQGGELKNNSTKSCGCFKKAIKDTNSQNLIGKKFGRLTVVSFIEVKKPHKYFECICDCGTTIVARENNLKSGCTKSCGCLKIEELKKRHHFTHGHSVGKIMSRTYQSWINMKRRCVNFKDANYHHYGGRGIIVCQRWLDSFENFLEDMGEIPDKLTIERIDNNGNYEKSNCKWATFKEQGRNRRNTKLTRLQVLRIREFIWAGIPHKELGVLFGVSRSTIQAISQSKIWKD